MDKLNALSTGTRKGKKGEVNFNQTIETAQQSKPRGEGWAKSNCEQALTEASLYQFKNVVAPALSIPINCPKTLMRLAKLEKIVVENTISVPTKDNGRITQVIFTDDSKNKFLQHLSEVKQAGNQAISVEDVLKIIKDKKLHTDRVTDRNWRSFLECKKIDRDIFIAFCKSLNINNWQNVVEPSPQPRNDLTKTTRLVQILDSFNHSAQTNLVYSSLSQQNIKAAFLVVNSCSYSRTWMLRRIEDDIKLLLKVEVQKETLCSQSSMVPVSVETLKSLFKQKFDRENLKNTLDKKYLFLIINIDRYDLDTLRTLVQNFWQPLNKINTQRRDTQASGKILLFLVGSAQGNNWQTEWRNHQILADSLAELSPAQPFNVNDLGGLISKSALKFGISIPDSLTDFSKTLLAENGGSTEKLLRLFYTSFNCSPSDFNRQWQNYPPT